MKAPEKRFAIMLAARLPFDPDDPDLEDPDVDLLL